MGKGAADFQKTAGVDSRSAKEAENAFLSMVHDPESRPDLLARLQRLWLLESFLEVERGGEVGEGVSQYGT